MEQIKLERVVNGLSEDIADRHDQIAEEVVGRAD